MEQDINGCSKDNYDILLLLIDSYLFFGGLIVILLLIYEALKFDIIQRVILLIIASLFIIAIFPENKILQYLWRKVRK